MTESNELKVSIVTICLNSERVIEKTIQSVLSQSYKNIEYIVVDGKSADNTLDIIKKHESGIDLVVTEKDTGVFNAMNKGLRLTTGDVVFFLNSGDYLYDKDVTKDVVGVFKRRPEVQLLYGNVMFDYGSKKQIREYKKLDRLFFSCSCISHQTIFAKKELFITYGSFDEELRFGGDLDWQLNLFLNHKKEIGLHFLDRVICVFDKKEGLSTKPFSYLDETMKILKRYYTGFELFFYYPICLVRQKIRKMFFEKRV